MLVKMFDEHTCAERFLRGQGLQSNIQPLHVNKNRTWGVVGHISFSDYGNECMFVKGQPFRGTGRIP